METEKIIINIILIIVGALMLFGGNYLHSNVEKDVHIGDCYDNNNNVIIGVQCEVVEEGTAQEFVGAILMIFGSFAGFFGLAHFIYEAL